MKVTRGARTGLYRQAVTYDLDQDGELVAVSPPSTELLARREGSLYRVLAGLAQATDEEIVAAATRYGSLGPRTRILNSKTDPAQYLYVLNRAMRDERRQFKDLRRWLASGSTIAIRTRLAPLANFIVAIANADIDATALYAEVVTDPEAVRSKPNLPELYQRLMDYHYRLVEKLDIPPETLDGWMANPEASVYVRVGPGNAARLQGAMDLVLTILETVDHIGGMDPDELARFAVQVSPYNVAGLFGLYPPETPDTWRLAAAELGGYTRALRDLRALRLGARQNVTPPLVALRTYSGMTVGGPDEVLSDHLALAADLQALLTLRLQQIGGWPYPAGQHLGTFARALWSLWRPVTATAPPRRCAWPAGCTSTLAEPAHGNRRLCDLHRRLAARDRSARVRARNVTRLVSGRDARPLG